MFNPFSQGKLVIVALVALLSIVGPMFVQTVHPDNASAATMKHAHKHKKHKHKHARKHKIRHSGGSSAWVLPRYVVMCESGGNPSVVNRTGAGAANGYPAGLYQITGPTWRSHGGTSFAPTADRASVWAQGVIAKRVLASQGPRAWACW